MAWDYEHRIKLLSKSLRLELSNHSALISNIVKSINELEFEDTDGGVFIDSFEYEAETEEIVFRGKGGTALRVAKRISEMYPGKKVRIGWLTDNFDSGKAIYVSGNIAE